MEQEPDRPAPASVPAHVAALAAGYVKAINATFPDVAHGIYLHGSVALGSYNPARSDVDILTVLRRPLSAAEIIRLGQLHSDLRRRNRLACKMQAQYPSLPDVLAKRYSAPCPTVSGGRLERKPGEVMALYWWQALEYSICLYGPAPAAFVPRIHWQTIREEMWRNLNRYLAGKVRSPLRWAVSPMAVEFAVLTACRILYTLATEGITTKELAGEYALKVLPAQWHRPVLEALRIRQGSSRHSLYRNPLRRSREVKAFILNIIEQCNQLYLADFVEDAHAGGPKCK